jgi:TolB protein
MRELLLGLCGMALLVTSSHGQNLVANGAASVFLKGLVSTEASEVKAAFSPDGSRILWGSMNRQGGPGGLNIWEVEREHGGSGWCAPRPVSFDSDSNDFDPFFSPDGKGVYFFSNREGGLGGDDIWFAPFDPATGKYGTPVNCGPNVNSKGDEWAPVTDPSGGTLLFASDGRGGSGMHDLFECRNVGGKWQPAEPLRGAVNSADEDFDATFLHDGTTIVFTRRTRDQDGADLYVAFGRHGVYDTVLRLPASMNAAGQWNLGPSIDLRLPGVLYVSSHREECSVGRLDILAIPYKIVHTKGSERK